MENKQVKNNGKVFPFKHSTLSIVFCVLALILCAVGIGLSIYRIIVNGIKEVTDALQSPFLILVSLLCAVIVVSVLIKSEYIVTDSEFITRFGFIKSRLPLATVTSMTHDRSTHKLTVYCGENFSVFTLKQEWEDDLVHEICTVNPKIDFSFTMTDNVPPKDDKKNKGGKGGNEDTKQD